MIYGQGEEARDLETVGWMLRVGDPERLNWRRLESFKTDARPLSPQDAATLLAFHQAGWLLLPDREMKGPPRDERRPQAALVRKEDDGLAMLIRRLVIQLNPDLTPAESSRMLDEVLDVQVIRPLTFATNLFEAELRKPADGPLDELIAAELARVRGTAGVVVAESALIEHHGYRAVELDPEIETQWQWEKIRTLDVWSKRELRGQDCTIAVIDRGFQVKHTDLRENVDRRRSASFDENDELVQGVELMKPEEKHGTWCAGMAAASLGNGVGGAGAAPDAKLMLIALPYHGVATQVVLARAIAYAAVPTTEPSVAADTPGADVISCSLGPSESYWKRTQVLELAVDFAVHQGRPQDDGPSLGCPVFWATYNSRSEIPDDAVSACDNVITVAGTDKNDQVGASGFGKHLDLLAPGIGVYTTDPVGGRGDRYDTVSGASMAAPCAAGVAALLLQAHPKWTWQQVKDALQSSAQGIAGTAGRIDALDALDRAAKPPRTA